MQGLMQRLSLDGGAVAAFASQPLRALVDHMVKLAHGDEALAVGEPTAQTAHLARPRVRHDFEIPSVLQYKLLLKNWSC